MSTVEIEEVQSETSQVLTDISQAYERGKVDINFFASICLPTVSIYDLPIFYIAIWQILVHRTPEQLGRLLRFALGLPRGHAKTTFIKILICWLIVYDKASFILIVCSNSDLAENLLADIHDILNSPNLKAIYGDWEECLAIDSADTKKGSYHTRTVTLVARGWKAGIRGLNLQNDRPDVIFCDDVQTRENDESPTERDKLLKELTGTIFKALAPRGNRLIIYVGNMYSDECILYKFKKSRSWISMVTGAILADGKPLWPELFSLDELMESYYHDEELGLAHIWFAEIMNDPRSTALSILPKPLPDTPESPALEDLLTIHDGAWLTIDPAGFRKTSDDNVISVGVKHDEQGYVVEGVRGIHDPEQIILAALRLAVKWNISLIGVEAVGYQQTLGFWIQKYLIQFKIFGITVVELSPHGRSKESRIRQFISELYAENWTLLSPEVRREFVWQASMYKIGKKDNKDDYLDATAYHLDIRNEYWHLVRPPLKAVINSEARVVPFNTPF